MAGPSLKKNKNNNNQGFFGLVILIIIIINYWEVIQFESDAALDF